MAEAAEHAHSTSQQGIGEAGHRNGHENGMGARPGGSIPSAAAAAAPSAVTEAWPPPHAGLGRGHVTGSGTHSGSNGHLHRAHSFVEGAYSCSMSKEGSRRGQGGGSPEPERVCNSGWRLGVGHEGSCGSASASGSESDCSSFDAGAAPVLLRIVPEASLVQPGHRTACSMPMDMNLLQESLEGMARLSGQRV